MTPEDSCEYQSILTNISLHELNSTPPKSPLLYSMESIESFLITSPDLTKSLSFQQFDPETRPSKVIKLQDIAGPPQGKKKSKLTEIWILIETESTRMYFIDLEKSLGKKIIDIDDFRKALALQKKLPFYKKDYFNLQVYLPKQRSENTNLSLLNDFNGPLKVDVKFEELLNVNYQIRIGNDYSTSTPGEHKETALRVILTIENDLNLDSEHLWMILPTQKERYQEMVQWANNVFGTKKCPYTKCDYETNNKALFVDHLNAIHIKYSNFSCEICDKLFYSKRALLKHKAKEHSVKHEDNSLEATWLSEATIEKQYENMIEWSKKFVIKNAQKTKCPYQDCDFVANDKTKIVDHINSSHIKFPAYVCSGCQSMFYSKMRSNDHMKICSRSSLFKPQREPPPITWANDVEAKEKHTKMLEWSKLLEMKKFEELKCPYEQCQYKSSEKQYYLNHINQIHIKYLAFICTGCGIGFLSKADQRKHEPNCTLQNLLNDEIMTNEQEDEEKDDDEEEQDEEDEEEDEDD